MNQRQQALNFLIQVSFILGLITKKILQFISKAKEWFVFYSTILLQF